MPFVYFPVFVGEHMETSEHSDTQKRRILSVGGGLSCLFRRARLEEMGPDGLACALDRTISAKTSGRAVVARASPLHLRVVWFVLR